MSDLLERMERQATILGDPCHGARRRPGRYTPITDIDLDRGEQLVNGQERMLASLARAPQGVLDHLAAAQAAAGAPWEPTALVGGLAGIETGADVPLADLTAVTGGTVNVAWWDSRQYTPIPPLAKKGVQYEMDAEGTVTSSAGSQTLTLNPHIGPSNTVGTNLTAATAQTLGTTITNAIWRLWAQITVRSIGAGTLATAVGAFRFEYTILANGGAPTTTMWRSSGGAATFDSTVLNGLVIGATPSAAGVSVTPRQIKWGSWGP
jgi:hypothetical protein